MADEKERVVVEGRACALQPGQPALIFATLSVGDREVGRHLSRKTFVVELDDGRSVEVEVDERTTRFVPLQTERAKWADLESRADAAPFRKGAPGPHVEAALASAVIDDRCWVSVEGVSLDTAFAGGGPRDASSRVVSRLRAVVVAWGSGATAARQHIAERAGAGAPRVSREESAPLVSPIEASFVIGAVLALGWAALDAYLPRRVDLAAVAAAFVLIALLLRLRRQNRQPSFYAGAGPAGGDPPSGAFTGTAVLSALLMGAPCVFVDYPGNVDDGHVVCATAGVFILWGCALAAVAWDAFRATKPAMTVARVVGDAKPHGSSTGDGTWGATEGVVVGRTEHEVLGELAPLSALAEEEYQSGSTPNSTRYVVVGKPFVVRTDGGAEIDVDPAGATWASRIRVSSPERPSSTKRRVQIFADLVPNGARVRVVGRMEGRRIASTGPESLFILASTTPAGLVVRPSAAERAFVLGLTALTVAVFAALVAWHPFLPAFYIPGD